MTTLFNPDTQTPYQVTDEEREAIASAIDTEELTTLALTLGNIPSRSGEEAEAGDEREHNRFHRFLRQAHAEKT